MSEPANHARSTGADEALYVGYLPMPRRDRRFLRLLVPTLLWGLCALSALLAAFMSPAGDAVWEPDTTRLTGALVANPYPALIHQDEDGDLATTFLVEVGKRGPRQSIGVRRGTSAEVEGFLLRRDRRSILELLPGDDGFAAQPTDPSMRVPVIARLGRATLRGEIVDYKCYLGAMKPGHGLTHRACARLCVSGGIPPALVVESPDGDRTYYILRTPAAGRLNAAVLPYIADPVEVTGNVVREVDVLYLETTPDQISRL